MKFPFRGVDDNEGLRFPLPGGMGSCLAAEGNDLSRFQPIADIGVLEEECIAPAAFGLRSLEDHVSIGIR